MQTTCVQPSLRTRPCVLFDFDGTIADTLPTIVATARRVLLDFGLTEDELGDMSRLVGPPFPDAFMQIYGLSLADANEVTDHYRKIYNTKGLEAWPAFPGMPEFLYELKSAGKTLAVASSKREELVVRGVKDNNLEDCFALVRGRASDTAGATKATIISSLAQDLGFSLNEIVMVGDRYHDVDAAHSAGVPCIGVYFGHTAPEGELEEAGAEAIAHTMRELRDIILGS